jgi:putative endopeptidase
MQQALTGQSEIKPRWKRCVSATDNALGEALGQRYVEQAFGADGKQRMLKMVDALEKSLDQDIRTLPWMTEETKKQAKVKLDAIRNKIGYPDVWRDYSSLKIVRGDLLGNFLRANEFEAKRQIAKIGKPLDRNEWQMTPPTVNAYYSPPRNEIVFPAGILQPPFFDKQADEAMNFGGIGIVIGHELTHGFDDQGRKIDADGRLRDWWTKDDATKFEARAKILGAQYSAFQPLPGVHVNGDLTMGENIADLGGLTLALDAYHASLKNKRMRKIDGLTGDQRVFLGWAQAWRGKVSDDYVKKQVVSDPHSPRQFRVNGPVRNIDAWYDAFDVKPDDKLYVAPASRVHIW